MCYFRLWCFFFQAFFPDFSPQTILKQKKYTPKEAGNTKKSRDKQKQQQGKEQERKRVKYGTETYTRATNENN